jgi:copper chaperone NosL
MSVRRAALKACATVALIVACTACGPSASRPEPLDTKHDLCISCRMTVSDRTLAAQLIASGDEPKFFDDLGCLSQYLTAHPPPRGATVFVADHRTGEWTPAAGAVFSRMPRRATPMASGLMAHATAESREADPRAAGSVLVPPADVLRTLAGIGDHAS